MTYGAENCNKKKCKRKILTTEIEYQAWQSWDNGY